MEIRKSIVHGCRALVSLFHPDMYTILVSLVPSMEVCVARRTLKSSEELMLDHKWSGIDTLHQDMEAYAAQPVIIYGKHSINLPFDDWPRLCL